MNILKTIRNNWKKTVVGTGLVLYAGNYLYNRNQVNRLHQAYCFEALKYSKEKVGPMQKIRRVTVFLNPISNNERGKGLYEKYASPMLHLSGLDVRLVRLDAKNEAKQYMEVIDDKDTDCIVIAGGNRTIAEAISSLINRPDAEQIFKRIKIGIIPLSEKNQFSENLFNVNLKTDTVKLIGNATLSIIKGETAPIDLIKVSFEGEGTNESPVYAFSNVAYGYFTDKQANLEKYWLYGPFKSYMNEYYIKRLAYFHKPEFSLDYCNNCANCKKCFKARTDKANPQVEIQAGTLPEKQLSFLQNLLVLFYKKSFSTKEKAEYEKRRVYECKLSQLQENADCGLLHELEGCKLTQLNAEINRPDQIKCESSGVDLTLAQLPLSLYRAKSLEPTERKLNVSEFRIKDLKNFKNKLIIDNEVYDLDDKDLTSIRVEYLNKSIQFLIDFNLNNENIYKKNANVNIYLSDYYLNNSINFRNDYLNGDLLEPFKRFYFSFCKS